MKHVFIATPAYSGQVNIPYALSLAETMHTLKLHGIQITPYITASGSLLVAERNKILEMFWQSDATHLLCVDADLGWPAQAVLAMLEQDKEFIAGCCFNESATALTTMSLKDTLTPSFAFITLRAAIALSIFTSTVK